METVYQQEPLSMGWCLECHRNPEPHLRHASDVTKLDWGLDMSTEERLSIGEELRQLHQINPSQDCSTCHR